MGLVHLSVLFSCAFWAQHLGTSQYGTSQGGSVHLWCSLNSLGAGLSLRPVIRTHDALWISKYRNVFQSLDGEMHGNFRFNLKLITNSYCWATECMKLGSLRLCALLLDYPMSNVLPLAILHFASTVLPSQLWCL